MRKIYLLFSVAITMVIANAQPTIITTPTGTNQGGNYSIDAISMLDADTGYACGGVWAASAIVLKTTDGGSNWNVIFDVADGYCLRDIEVVNKDIIYASGGVWQGNQVFLKSTDAGANWSVINPSTGVETAPYMSYNMDVIDKDTIYFQCYRNTAGTAGLVLKSTDAGSSWVAQEPYEANMDGISMVGDGQMGFAVTRSEKILYTSNYGVTWEWLATANSSTFAGGNMRDVYFIEQNSITYGLTASDGGVTLFKDLVPEFAVISPNMKGVFMIDSTNLLACGNSGKLFYSNDGNSTEWDSIVTGTTENLLAISVVDDTVAYISGENRTILKWIVKPNPDFSPTVNVSSPIDASIVALGDDVAVNVTASDADGTIDSVSLFLDGVFYETLTSDPYNFIVTSGNLSEGIHKIFAVAFDNDLNYTTSDTITITVEDQTSIRNNNNSKVSVYPIPTPGIIHIDNAQGDVVSIVSINNLTVKKLQINKSSVEVDLSSLTNGVYYLLIDGVYKQKIVINR